MQAQMTIGIQANLDALNKSIKAINKATRVDLGLNITKAIDDSMKELKKAFAENQPIEEINKLKKGIREATKTKLNLDFTNANKQLWDFKTSIIATYASMKGLVSKPISASIDFNNAINEINRFSNFTDTELKIFKKDIWSLGKTNGVKLDDIIKTSELSAKLGIAKQDLKSFSQLALDMQVGLGLGVEQSTEIGVKLSKAFGLSTKELAILLDETTAMSKSVGVSGQKILEVISSIASGAKAFGLSAKETSALSASFLSVGLDSSEASSSINKFFTELNNIDNASEGFKRSLSKMGLDAEQLKEDIANNPQEAIKNLFADLNDLDDEERFGVISEIFGKKMANNINSAKDGIKAFEKALESSKDSAGALGRAVDRAAGDGFGDVVIQLSSAFKHLGVSIGNGFVPVLKPLFEGIKNITNAFSGFLDNHQWAATIGAMAGVGLVFVKTIGLLAMAFKPLGFLIFYPFQLFNIKAKIATITTYALKGAMFALNGAFKIVGIGVSLFSKAFRFAMTSIKGALISTGVGALIVGLGFAIEYAYNHWEGIKDGFVAVWEWIKEGISPIMDWFKGIFDWISEGIRGIIDSVKGITDFLGFTDDKAIDVNKTTHLKGSIDEVITKQNENKAKMLSAIQGNQTDNSRQINDYKTITINTNANPQAIASAINSYSYDDEF